jgi:hypothetical protein
MASSSSPPLSPSKVPEAQLIVAKAKAAAKKSKGDKSASVATNVQDWHGQGLNLINCKYIRSSSRYLIVRSLQTPPDATVWLVAGSSNEQNRM